DLILGAQVGDEVEGSGGDAGRRQLADHRAVTGRQVESVRDRGGHGVHGNLGAAGDRLRGGRRGGDGGGDRRVGDRGAPLDGGRAGIDQPRRLCRQLAGGRGRGGGGTGLGQLRCGEGVGLHRPAVVRLADRWAAEQQLQL